MTRARVGALDTKDDNEMDFQELIAQAENLTEAGDEDLATLEDKLVAAFDAIVEGKVEDVAADDVEKLTQLRDAIMATRAERTKRETEAAERAEEVAKLTADVKPEVPQPGAEADAPVAEAKPDPEVKVEIPDTIADIDATPAPEEPAPAEAEAVTAAAPEQPTLSELAARTPASRLPVVTSTTAMDRTIRLIAEGRDVPWIDFAQAMVEAREALIGYTGDSVDKQRIGRFDWRSEYDDERRLEDGDNRGNTRKVDSLCAAATRDDSWDENGNPQGALVASGGFCAPTPAVYDVLTISGAQRPVRDALPSFNADRGGLRWTAPPDLTDILVDQSGGAVGEWSRTTDITPGENVKTTQTVACGTVVEAFIGAIYRSVQIGNFQARAYPEWVAAWMDLVMAAWARKGENELLTAIAAASTPVTTTQFFGTVRDLLPYTVQLSAAEKNRQRAARDMRQRVLLPYWIIAAMQQDLMHQGYENFSDSNIPDEASITRWYGKLGVNVSFYDDTADGAGQIVGLQGAGNDLRNLPATVEWYLFHEGAHVFLDGGTLDLGQIRDSALVETNDYRMFAESFEGHAFRGIYSYKLRSAICSSGAGSLGEDSSNYCAAS